MYGMVNKAVRGFVLKNFNAETWAQIHTTAGVSEDFVSMQSYDDDVTYNLVGAAVEHPQGRGQQPALRSESNPRRATTLAGIDPRSQPSQRGLNPA